MLGKPIAEFLHRSAQQQLSGAAWSATLETSSSAGSEHFDDAVDRGRTMLMQTVAAIAPLLGILLATAVAVNVAQTGFRWLPERLAPDIGRLSPLAGLRRIFSLGGGQRLAMGWLKMLCVLLVAYFSLWHRRDEIVNIAALDVPQLAMLMLEITYSTCLKIAIALVVLAVADYGYQRWKLERDLQMSPEELREELRNQQGDPNVRSRRRTMQRQQAVDRVVAAVPRASIIVVAGNRLAVAIRYDPAMPAPVVVAKGAGDVAEQIRRTADKHGVPSVERHALAESLYRHTGFNQPISSELFDGVAEILAQSYRLEGDLLLRRAA
jgi:flagellar biosynthetic protein FlhB